MRAKQYSIYDAPPPAHWYSHRVGWFGKALTGTLVVSLSVVGGFSYVFTQNNIRSLASAASQTETLDKANATPLPPVAAQNIVDLQPVLDAWVAENPNQQWGIMVKSLDGPTFNASAQADRQFKSASMYKLFLTLPLFEMVAAEHQKGVNVNVNGKQRSLATCVDLMLRVSNNECGDAIGQYVDWQKATSILQERGFKQTDFSKRSGLETSAGDTAAFLEQLHGDLFNRNAKDTIMTSLKQQRWRAGIPTGCPGCETANKTGTIDKVMHDAAIIEYNGGTYVLSIFSEGGSFKQIAQVTGQIQQRILDTTQ